MPCWYASREKKKQGIVWTGLIVWRDERKTGREKMDKGHRTDEKGQESQNEKEGRRRVKRERQMGWGSTVTSHTIGKDKEAGLEGAEMVKKQEEKSIKDQRANGEEAYSSCNALQMAGSKGAD